MIRPCREAASPHIQEDNMDPQKSTKPVVQLFWVGSSRTACLALGALSGLGRLGEGLPAFRWQSKGAWLQESNKRSNHGVVTPFPCTALEKLNENGW